MPDATPARWTLLAPLVTLGVFGVGLVLNAASLLYDDAHWDLVYEVSPRAAADRNGLADLGGAVIGRGLLLASAVALVGLLVAAVGLMLRQRWAHVGATALAAPFVVCCGFPYVSNLGAVHEFDDPQYLNRRASYAPFWLLVSDTAGPLLIVAGAVAAVVVLLLPPVRRRFHRSSPGFPTPETQS